MMNPAGPSVTKIINANINANNIAKGADKKVNKGVRIDIIVFSQNLNL